MRRRKGSRCRSYRSSRSSLQWGRLHAEAERDPRRAPPRRDHRASMGPPPCGGGKTRLTTPVLRASLSFNGAASMRRRKAQGRRQEGRVYRGFNGAASMRRRKAGRDTGRRAAPARFNGAASMRRRKVPSAPTMLSRHSRLQWGRLHAEAERPWACSTGTRRTSRFNGAASMRRRKGQKLIRTWAADAELQWGRLHAEAERIPEAPTADRVHRASMGPPPCGGGKELDGDLAPGRPHASMGPPPCGGGKGRRLPPSRRA